MTVVKSLAHLGITICATVHSPTPYCFDLFDRLVRTMNGVMAGGVSHARAMQPHPVTLPMRDHRAGVAWCSEGPPHLGRPSSGLSP